MKVTETKTKEFKPYKISIKAQGSEFIVEYYIKPVFIAIDGINEHIVHSENYPSLNAATKRFSEVIEEII